jgi:hypothetical protein
MDPLMAIGLLAAAQVVGLLSAAGARFSAGSRGQTFFQRLFMAWFAVLGMITPGAFIIGPGYVLACGTSLAVMLLAATWDVRVAA